MDHELFMIANTGYDDIIIRKSNEKMGVNELNRSQPVKFSMKFDVICQSSTIQTRRRLR